MTSDPAASLLTTFEYDPKMEYRLTTESSFARVLTVERLNDNLDYLNSRFYGVVVTFGS